MKKILVIFGGKSGEHEVSRRSAETVLMNIDTEKFDVIKIGITKDGEWFKTNASPADIASGKWEQLEKTHAVLSPDRKTHGIIVDGKEEYIDAIIPVMHGDYCEDGCIQGLFEMSGVPYVGPGVLASSVGMDKSATKLFADAAGVPQAEWVLVEGELTKEKKEEIENKFSYPIFVKPCNAGSSLGAFKVHDKGELDTAVAEAAKVDYKVLCEEYVNGYEVECAVLGNGDAVASCAGMITPSNEFYDYKAKYIDNKSGLIIPAPLPEETTEKIREYAVKIFKALGCKGLSRVDFFVHKESGKIYFNEINTLPGFTSISMYPKLWEACGVPIKELITKLVDYAEK